MSPQSRAALRRRLDRLVQAAKEEAFAGSAHPEDRPIIRKELDDAREAVMQFFTNPPKPKAKRQPADDQIPI